jgi:hypothetical protein
MVLAKANNRMQQFKRRKEEIGEVPRDYRTLILGQKSECDGIEAIKTEVPWESIWFRVQGI